jgi:4-hydroxy-tetrahydrodipicolinate synthase
MAVRHFSEIARARTCPSSCSSTPRVRHRLPPETLARLVEIPNVVAVKEWSNDIVGFEASLRAVRATGRPVAILSAFTMSLMASFLLGADGAISGMGSVTADLQVELFEACAKGDIEGARAINDRLDPLVRAFYAPPFVDMHNRMKEALVMLGRIPAAHVRPPLTPVSSRRERPPPLAHANLPLVARACGGLGGCVSHAPNSSRRVAHAPNSSPRRARPLNGRPAAAR